MESDEMIVVDAFCRQHCIELSFINSLRDSGLLECHTIEEKICIPVSQLPFLEKIVRLYELDINLEGIEAITYLLQRLGKQQEVILTLSNRLSRYENEEE